MKLKILFLLLASLFINELKAQQYPTLWNEILDFKKQESETPIVKNEILFVGSSSFKFWKDVDSYFPDHKIINRGFGGSTLIDVTRYFYDIIYPFEPRQIVIYCGENDFAFDENLSVNDFVRRFTTLFGMIRENFPNTTINYLSIKPSPSRTGILEKSMIANEKIASFLDAKDNAEYIDILNPMMDKKGRIKKDIFLEDQLHMNPEGYKIWQKIIAPYLKD